MALGHDTDGSYSKLVEQQNGRARRNRFPGDEDLIVLFKEDAIPDDVASEAAGYPKFRDADVIEIWVPGDRFNKIEREITEADKIRFKERYAEYKDKVAPAESGLPLALWPGIAKAMIKELAHFHIKTVEQLAALSDGNAQNVGPVSELRQRARDYLAIAKDGAATNKMRNEINARDVELSTLKKIVEQQGLKIEEMRAGPTHKKSEKANT